MTAKTLLLAEWVAPMDQPMIREGGIAFAHGTIVEVAAARELRQRHRDARVEELGSAVLLPGLVNAHTHLELTSVAARPDRRERSFVDWVLELMSHVRTHAGDDLRSFVQQGVRDGVAQCLRFGVTTVGDVTRNPALSRPVLASSGLRAISFGEIVGMAGRRAAMTPLLVAARDRTHESDRLRVGLEPHAPYSLDLRGYAACAEVARSESLPITTHLAETPHEAAFLAEHRGEFRRLWEVLGDWAEGVTRFEGGPIRAVQSAGLLDLPAVLAHVNYCDDDELEILARSRASVVYCPRTHDYFAHPPHRWREMRARGINIAVGTDSCASSPDLDLVDELRLLHRIAPDLPATELWSMATIRGAKALGLADRAGSLAAGKDADLLAFHVATDDPLAEVLEADRVPAQVWVAGQRRD